MGVGASESIQRRNLVGLAEEGFDKMYGARPLARAIQRHLENPLSKRILSGDFGPGSKIVVDVENDRLTFAESGIPMLSVT